MATAEAAIRPHGKNTTNTITMCPPANQRTTPDRQKGRRPFASWMKRLANLKNSTSSNNAPNNDKKSALSRTKRKVNNLNNPYPESGFVRPPAAPSTFSGRASSFTPASITSDGRAASFASYEDSTGGRDAPMRSNKSAAPTLATNPETIHSDTGFSRAGTTYTDGIYSGRANSTFSSPRASQESLTTTLTTIQSTAPSAMMNHVATGGGGGSAATNTPVQFSHQYPVSPPASAVPSHLQQPATFAAATAGNLLTDNASILTLASSSKRRRRNSLDTNASVRAIAPSSVWGNSRESLPLSVLSRDMERDVTTPGASTAFTPTAVAPGRPSLSGLASAERASVYSNPGGVGAPALVSERNSYYSTKQSNMDAVSVRSGHLGLGHGRTESINGSISGGLDRMADRAATAASPLASPVPRDLEPPKSRRTSAWKENVEEETEESDAHDEEDETVKIDGAKCKGKAKERSKSVKSGKSGHT